MTITFLKAAKQTSATELLCEVRERLRSHELLFFYFCFTLRFLKIESKSKMEFITQPMYVRSSNVCGSAAVLCCVRCIYYEIYQQCSAFVFILFFFIKNQ